MEKEIKYMVCTRCFTYNHAPYIEDALRGFTIQQTSFPFVSVVVDDASTDNTAEIIERFVDDNFDFQDESIAYKKETEYASISFARHKTNTNCYFAVLLLKENHYSKKKNKMVYLKEWFDHSKYLALCEGDDYWIEPEKIQKQVKVLEENQDYSMCFHNAKTYSVKLGCYIDKFKLPSRSRLYKSKEIYANGWFVPTASMLYRNVQIYQELNEYRKKNCQYAGGDILLLLFLSSEGPFWYIAEEMSVYRLGVPGSATERNYKKDIKWKTQLDYLKLLKYCNKKLFNYKHSLWVLLKYAKCYYKMLISKSK